MTADELARELHMRLTQAQADAHAGDGKIYLVTHWDGVSPAQRSTMQRFAELVLRDFDVTRQVRAIPMIRKRGRAANIVQERAEEAAAPAKRRRRKAVL